VATDRRTHTDRQTNTQTKAGKKVLPQFRGENNQEDDRPMKITFWDTAMPVVAQ